MANENNSSFVSSIFDPLKRFLPKANEVIFCAVFAMGAFASTASAVDLQFTQFSDTQSPAPNGSDPSPAGATVVYDIRLENSAGDIANNAVALFDIPAGTTLVGSTAPNGCTQSGTRVTCLLGNVAGTAPPANGSSIDIQLQISTAGLNPGPISVLGALGNGPAPAAGVALASLATNDPFFAADTNIANNRLGQTTTLTNSGNLQLVKTATPSPVVGGSEITYTVTVTNLGPSASTNFNVADTLPSAAVFVPGSASGAGWTFNNQDGTYSGTLPVGAANAVSYSFRARVTAGSGTVVNSAVVNAVGTPDPIQTNNTGSVSTPVRAGADLTIGKTVTPAPAISGQQVTFTLTPRNLGPSAAAGTTTVTDVMPAGFTIVSITPTGVWNCGTSTATTATCTRTSMAVSANQDIVIVALVPATGAGSSGVQTNSTNINNTTTPDPNGPSLGVNNNDASVNFTVLPDGADLAITKSKGPGVVAVYSGVGPDADSQMTSRIDVSNIGPRAATGQVQVVDVLAVGEEFVSAGAPWTCSASVFNIGTAQTVTCNLDASALPLGVGANAPTLSLITRARAAGVLQNTACTGGSGGSVEPITGSADRDPVTSNDCAGAQGRATNERSDLSVTKRTNAAGAGDNVITAAGTSVTYTIVVSNNGPDGTAGVVMNDPIPGYLAGRTPDPTFTAPAGWSCSFAGGTVTCNSGNTVLASNANVSIPITVQRPLADSIGATGNCNGAAITDQFCNTAGVGVDAAVPGSVGEIDRNNNAGSDTIRIDRVANMQTTAKSITSAATGQAGVNTSYQIDYKNDGPSTAPGVVFRDVITLPANDTGFVLISAVRTGGGNTSCTLTPGAGITTAPAAGGTSYANPTAGTATITLTCEALTLSNQQVEAVNLLVRPNVDATNMGRTFTNVADFFFDFDGNGSPDPASGTDGSGTYNYNSVANAADDQRSASLPFTAGQVDLITNKTDFVDPVGFNPNDLTANALTYRIRVQNQGPSVSTNTVISDVITPPAGRTIRFVGDSTAQAGPFAAPSLCAITAGTSPSTGAPITLTCTMPGAGFTPNVSGTVAPGSFSDIYVSFQYETAPGANGDTVIDLATASSSEGELDATNNFDDETTTIRARADVAATKAAYILTPSASPTAALPVVATSVTIRQPFFYVVEGVNNGPGSSLSRDRTGTNPLNGTGTIVTDTLPAGLTVTGPITWEKVGPNPGSGEVPNGTGACTDAAGTVTCNIGDLTFAPSNPGRVRIIIPARWDSFPAGGPTTTNNAVIATEQVDPDPNNNTPSSPLDVTRSSIAGTVFVDNDRAGANGGTQQNGEPGVGDGTTFTQIVLTGTDAYNNPVSLTTFTDANGNYSFANLSPSNSSGYTITETQPTGYQNGPVNTPTTGGSEPSLAGTYAAGAGVNDNSTYTAVQVGANQDGVRYNFPEVQRTSISGTVYVDRDRGNDFDTPGEPGIPNVTLNLFPAGTTCPGAGAPLQSTTTDPTTGAYVFNGVESGTGYVICEGATPGYADGNANGVPGSNQITIANLPLTGLTDQNFGELLASISGVIYEDYSVGTPANNNNGVRDAGENAIGSIPVTLSGSNINGPITPITINTQPDGSYVFPDLLQGTYIITEGAVPAIYGDGIDSVGTIGGAAVGNNTTNDVLAAIVLPAGGVGIAYNFAELPITTISGIVYIDRDNNNALDGTDIGRIGGVTLNLFPAGTVCPGAGAPLQTTTTNATTGAYQFTNVAAGQSYVICETQPALYGNGNANGTAGSNQINVTNLPVAGLTNQNFGEIPASIAGNVYVDRNNNGAFNNTGGTPEIGINSVPVTLSGSDANGTPITPITVNTGINGNYLFPDLPAGTYVITEGAVPAQYTDGIDTVGTINGAPVGIVGADVFTAVILPAGGAGIDYNFGERLLANISGSVYVDRGPAPNNTLDAGETLLTNVVLGLFPAGTTCPGVPANAIQTTTTVNGAYSFNNLDVGVAYVICETQPSGYGNGNANGTPGSNQINVPALPSTGSQNNNFGELGSTISGTVFLDGQNNGGAPGAGDTGLNGVSVTLSGTDIAGNPITPITIVTSGGGNYSFGDLIAGTYTITEQAVQPVDPVSGLTTLNAITTAGNISGVSTGTATPVTSTPSAITAIALGAGVNDVRNDFAEILPVSLSGIVFFDANNSGTQDQPASDLGVAGNTITLTGTNDLGQITPITITTGATGTIGSYAFNNLRPGTYTVTQPTQPTGTVNGITTPGAVGAGTATAPTVTPSAISNINLTTPGTNSPANNFAEIPSNSSISGFVWLDRNNNGVYDTATESPIPGVVVTLSGTDASGNAITPINFTTLPDGSYSFGSLPPGTYIITQQTAQPTVIVGGNTISTLNGITVAGSTNGTVTTPTISPSVISAVSLGVSQNSINNNFGEIPVSSIAGNVYSDNNNNGLIDSGEGGIGSVTITLSGVNDLGVTIAPVTITTNPDGSYSFPNLRPGTYVVTEPTQPPMTLPGITTPGTIAGTSVGAATPVTTAPSVISAIVLPTGGQSINNNFGEIGDSPDVVVSKTATPAVFTTNNRGSYTIRVRNIGQQPTSGVYTIRDRLPAGVSLVAAPTGTAWTCNGAVGASSFECTSSTVIAIGATSANTITVLVNVAATAAANSPVNNAVLVEGGGENSFRGPSAAELNNFNNQPNNLPVCDPAITQNACRLPTPVQLSASVSGTVWFDIGSSDVLLDGGDQRLPTWIVEVINPTTGAVIARTTTAADGTYSVANLVPGTPLFIQFRDPNSGIIWGRPVNGEQVPGSPAPCGEAAAIANGTASSCTEIVNGNTGLRVVLAPGVNLPQQSLPVDPSGIVYDSITRLPVPGSVVTLTPVGTCAGYAPATSILNAAGGGYNVNGNSISMTVGANGFYQFLFAPTAPASCQFQIAVTPPATHIAPSTLIPVESTTLNPPGAAGSSFEVQPQPQIPTGPVGPATTYYFNIISGSGKPGIIHNHIPLDPLANTGLVISKTGDRQTVEIGDTMLYSITIRQTAGGALPQVSIQDRLPAGFTYISGTARVNNAAIADPAGQPGPVLAFNAGPLALNGQLILTYRVRINVGSQEGDGINRAQAFGCSFPTGCIDPITLQPLAATLASNQAQYRVRVTGGVFTTEGCVLGKIFVDCNNNHIQDREELGIPGVRMYFEDGTYLISDSEGKYSYCGLEPKSHTLKVDGSTMPTKSRLTTSSNRNLGDADSLFIDLKNGELHRADFIEGSCSNEVLEQVKARRTQGEIRAPETERGKPPLRFESKPVRTPQQGTDSSNQNPIVDPRPTDGSDAAKEGEVRL